MSGSGLFVGELAVVTGSASNIGRSIARTLAREGAAVVLVDIDSRRNAETAAEIAAFAAKPEQVITDLGARDGWKAVIDGLGPRVPHMLVHAACPPRHEKDTPLAVDEATFDAMLNTNVRSGFMSASMVMSASCSPHAHASSTSS